MFCINCGYDLPDEATFCLKCGKPQTKQGAEPYEIIFVKVYKIYCNDEFLACELNSTNELIVNKLYILVKKALEQYVPDELRKFTKKSLGIMYGLEPVEIKYCRWGFRWWGCNYKCLTLFANVVEDYLISNGWNMLPATTRKSGEYTNVDNYYTKS
jgi:hypothetical protein